MASHQGSDKQTASGAAPRAPDGCRVYAVGDIHGRADLLETLLAKIADDAASRPPAERQFLIFLGDYINRGRGSCKVIDTLLDGIPDGFEVIYLKGNHEVMLDWFLENPAKYFARWLSLGGEATMASYGVDVERLAIGPGYALRCRDSLAEAVPERHRNFFRDLEISASMGDYFFVHGGVRPGVPLEAQVEQDLLWIMDEFLRHEAPFPKVVVHGHTPMDAPELLANRLSIDTRAWFSGCLTAVRLEGTAQELVMTRPTA